MACDQCGHSHWQYHSCRNRHCPQCGARAQDAWLQGRLAEVLPVPYAHLVFTLPHSLNGLYGAHPRWLIDTLFTCTAQTLAEFAANPKWTAASNATPAFSLVLHTWTQDLLRHIHLHAVMACGVLDKTAQWITPKRKPDFLFPVQALSRVFRGKFLAALASAHHHGDIEHDPQGDANAWCERQRQLYKHDWCQRAGGHHEMWICTRSGIATPGAGGGAACCAGQVLQRKRKAFDTPCNGVPCVPW